MRSRPLGHAILESDTAPVRPRDAASLIAVTADQRAGIDLQMPTAPAPLTRQLELRPQGAECSLEGVGVLVDTGGQPMM